MTISAEELAGHRTIDFTTYGRKSGQPRRIEIWWFHFEDRFIITGTPGRRDWLANVRSNPNILIHVGGDDFEGTAEEVSDPEFRRSFFEHGETSWYQTQAGLDALVESAPMIEVSI